MAFFNNLKNTASAVGRSAANVVNTGATDAKENGEINEIKRELAAIEADITSGYAQIGKKCVEYVKLVGGELGVDISSELSMLEPKFDRKDELNAKMIEIEKLDRAKAMDLVTQEEYDAKVSKLRKRVANFEAIKKVEQKRAMGIITEAEKEAEIAALLS